MKKCKGKNCTQLFPKYGNDKTKIDGIATVCKICRNEQKKKYRDKVKVLKPIRNEICDFCNRPFKTSLYNKTHCSTKCTNKAMHIRQHNIYGGKFQYQARRTAIRRIKSKNAPNKNKLFSKKDIEIINSNLATSEKAELLGRTTYSINAKFNGLKKEERKLSSVSYIMDMY